MGISIDRLLDVFEYCDGHLLWKSKVSRKVVLGKSAGCVSTTDGYKYVRIDGKRLSVHRVIFAMHNGFFPDIVDHIDGSKLNNKIDNLRAATKSQNTRNSRTPKTNSSGVKFVSWHKGDSAWRVRFCGMHIGNYKDKGLAEAAAIYFERLLYGEFARNHTRSIL